MNLSSRKPFARSIFRPLRRGSPYRWGTMRSDALSCVSASAAPGQPSPMPACRCGAGASSAMARTVNEVPRRSLAQNRTSRRARRRAERQMVARATGSSGSLCKGTVSVAHNELADVLAARGMQEAIDLLAHRPSEAATPTRLRRGSCRGAGLANSDGEGGHRRSVRCSGPHRPVPDGRR
jgi:hypothetical protein